MANIYDKFIPHDREVSTDDASDNWVNRFVPAGRRIIEGVSEGGGGGSTDLTLSRDATSITILSSSGADIVIPAADTSNAGVMTEAMFDKLAGIATGATVNSSDATLLARANHTGTQAASTISDFSEAVDDRVGSLLVAGANVTLTYNDGANTLTVASSGGGGGGLGDGDYGDITVSGSSTVMTIDNNAVTYAKMQNVSATSRVLGRITASAGNVEELTGANIRTIANVANGATANSSDATLLARANHTGTQAIATIAAAATARLFGRNTAGAGAGEELDATTVRTMLNVANGATANSSDATLLARANHTGTQAISTILAAATSRIFGRITASGGPGEEMTGTQATTLLDTFTSGLKGLAPASGGGTANYLRADGTWAAPAGGAGGRTLVNTESFYVNGTTGNDANDGLTLGTAFATLQAAYNSIANDYDHQGTDCELNIADGTYTGFAADKPLVGVRYFYINGNPTTPANVVINQISGGDDCIAGRDPTNHLVLYGISFSSNAANGDCIHISHGQCHVSGNCRFLLATKNYFDADTNGIILISGNNTILGNCENVFAPTEGGSMAIHGTITFSGTPTASGSIVLCADNAHLSSDATYSGSVNGQRYRCIRTANILTTPSSTTHFPGTIAGTTDQNSSYNGASGSPGATLVIFTASGTWTKPAGLAAIIVKIAGGGGAGGSCVSASAGQIAAGGGGGGGGFSMKRIAASALGSTETVTVGAGGAAGAVGNNNGGTGGTTSFGAHCSAVGGGGGGGATSAVDSGNFGANVGAGGTASGGDLNISGQPGGRPHYSTAANALCISTGAGGGAPTFGYGAKPQTSALTGLNGAIYGDGASGGASYNSGAARSGGDGLSGVVVVEEYYA